MKIAKYFLALAAIGFALPFSALAGSLSLSQSYVNIRVGQTATVNIQPTGGQVANIVYNSSSNTVSAVVNGNNLTLLGMGSGNAEIRLCTSSNDCGTVNVSVGGSGNYQGNGITFSNSSISLSVGQSSNVSIYSNGGYYGNYYVSSNSNSSVASVNISGSSLYLTANASGSTSITICQSGYTSSCGTLYVSVSGGYSDSGITFSPSSLSVAANNTASATIYHSHYYTNSGDNFYVSSNSNSSVATTTIAGSRLDVRGLVNGSTTVNVCNYNYSGCGSINVTVTGYSITSIWASPSSLNLNLGQSGSATIYTDSGAYYNSNFYVSNNSNSSAVSASVSGNTVYFTGNNYGTSSVTVCSNSGNYLCTTITVTVGSGNSYGYLSFAATSLPQPVVNQYYSYQLSVSNGTWPYSFYVNSGSLPNGLSLNSQGLISGTPTVSGTYSFQVRAQDNAGRSATQSFTMTIASVSGASTFKNGSLIRENGTIYTVYKNLKSGFANMEAFTGLGYKLSNVTDAGSTSLANSGYVIGSSQTAHPWGTWIKQGATVYFVHENGLIPVAYYDVFLNNGGEDCLVVPANYYDFIGKQVLPVMSNNDWRLR